MNYLQKEIGNWLFWERIPQEFWGDYIATKEGNEYIGGPYQCPHENKKEAAQRKRNVTTAYRNISNATITANDNWRHEQTNYIATVIEQEKIKILKQYLSHLNSKLTKHWGDYATKKYSSEPIHKGAHKCWRLNQKIWGCEHRLNAVIDFPYNPNYHAEYETALTNYEYALSTARQQIEIASQKKTRSKKPVDTSPFTLPTEANSSEIRKLLRQRKGLILIKDAIYPVRVKQLNEWCGVVKGRVSLALKSGALIAMHHTQDCEIQATFKHTGGTIGNYLTMCTLGES